MSPMPCPWPPGTGASFFSGIPDTRASVVSMSAAMGARLRQQRSVVAAQRDAQRHPHDLGGVNDASLLTLAFSAAPRGVL